MATTHALAGVALAALVATLAPEYGTAALIAGAVGGFAPDLDLYAGHRRTLHYPVLLPALAAPATLVAFRWPAPATVGLAVFLLAAGLHSAMDALGGGLELRPWEGDSEWAVYDHVRGRWIAPRRWIRYDGAPEDLALGVALAVPGLATFDPRVDRVLVGVLAISAVYVVLRRRLVTFAEWVVGRVPSTYLAYVPERFVRDLV